MKANNVQLKIPVLLQKITLSLSDFLMCIIPQKNENWWENYVNKFLSHRQQQYISQQNGRNLSNLDLAALQRIFDMNWYWISEAANLSREDRHYLKEMQTIRNRYAHSSSDGFSPDDLYRDIDTIQRFATLIKADSSLIQEIQNTKKLILSSEFAGEQVDSIDSSDNTVQTLEFQVGQIVFLKSNPAIQGVITESKLGKPENRYNVFINNEIQAYYASQLKGEQKNQTNRKLTQEQLQAYLTSLQINYPGLQTLYSLNAARIDFVPYQFRPVLKFIRSDRPRLLIADSVGVGKTIEAGLILRELQARRDIDSVLIICPRPLVAEQKWRNEMKRFEEKFEHIDGRELQYCIRETDLDGEWPDKFKKAIIPYSLFDEALLDGKISNGKRKIKQKKGLLDLDPPPRFDLVIVDEAHHIRNTDTIRHKVVRFFCDHAEAVIFMTATPIQLGSHDLYVLLNTLRPDLIIDYESYQYMAEPNPFINKAISFARSQNIKWELDALAALDTAADTAWGRAIIKVNPEFNQIRNRLIEGGLSHNERVQMINDIELLHTFSGIINRTRRRDIGDFAVRKPETVNVSFTAAQQNLHDEILKVQAEIFSRLHSNAIVKFIMTTIRRQVASCIFGLVPFLKEILTRHLDELTWAEIDGLDVEQDISSVNDIAERINSIIDIAQNLDSEDPKLNALRKIINDKQGIENNKIMVFSTFRHTLNYLHRCLKADGYRIGMVHGHVPDLERAELREHFALNRDHPEALDVLLFSEVGCEGLDYQFSDCIVNYDLPWNPMRVEQRIGRIDRRGQRSEAVAIYNLITPGTVDADIYERCLLRIGVFNQALGDNEEILGEISTEIKNIAENLTLSSEERRKKLDQLADNKIREIQEQQRLEEKEFEFFGIRLAQDQITNDIKDASSYWLTPNALFHLVNRYLKETVGADQDYILGEKPLKTLRLSEEGRRKLLLDFQKLKRKTSPAYRRWENWLKGGDQYLPLTFESTVASAQPQVEFIMPVHPLIKQAAHSFEIVSPPLTELKVETNKIPEGSHLFVIYQWRYLGIREDQTLRPIAANDNISENLSMLLELAQDTETNKYGILGASNWDSIDAHHHQMWSEAKDLHRRKTMEIAEYQQQSLTRSHQARMAILSDQLVHATHEKIRRMRESQIASAQSDYSRRIQDLNIAKERADIAAQPVVYGILHVERKN